MAIITNMKDLHKSVANFVIITVRDLFKENLHSEEWT